jgi:hypothetical protein
MDKLGDGVYRYAVLGTLLVDISAKPPAISPFAQGTTDNAGTF